MVSTSTARIALADGDLVGAALWMDPDLTRPDTLLAMGARLWLRPGHSHQPDRQSARPDCRGSCLPGRRLGQARRLRGLLVLPELRSASP